jgi:hypothetical protein
LHLRQQGNRFGGRDNLDGISPDSRVIVGQALLDNSEGFRHKTIDGDIPRPGFICLHRLLAADN